MSRPPNRVLAFAWAIALSSWVSAAIAGNAPPVIQAFNTDYYAVVLGSPNHFALLATDPDGDPLSCTVDLTGGGQNMRFAPCSGTVEFDYTYPNGTRYDPLLTVTDGQSTVTRRLPSGTIRVDAPTSVTVTRPEIGSTIPSQLRVFARVTSTFDADTVIARLGGRQVALAYTVDAPCDGPGSDCGDGFFGVLDLTGLARGEYMLQTEFESITDEHALDYRHVTLDDPPTLNVTAPEVDAVARPTLRVTAQCTGDMPGCTIAVSVLATNGNWAGVGSAGDTFDAVVNLSPGDGMHTILRVIATEAAGRSAIVYRNVYVESSNRITEIDTARGKIIDVDATRLLSVVNDDAGDRLFLRDRATDAETEIPLPAGRDIREDDTVLTPIGAAFAAPRLITPHTTNFFEWNGTVLLDHGTFNADMHAAGRYVIWHNAGTLYQRDVVAATTISTTGSLNHSARVEADGVVTYTDSYQLARWDGVNTTILVSDTSLWRLDPDADGSRVVYRPRTPCCAQPELSAIVLLDGANEIELRPLGPIPNGLQSEVEDGWVAYTRTGGLGQNHVWSYSPSNEQRQRTFFSVNSSIAAMGQQGEVMVRSQNRFLLSDADGRLFDVAGANGETYPLQEGWLQSISGVLFRINGTAQSFDDGFE